MFDFQLSNIFVHYAIPFYILCDLEFQTKVIYFIKFTNIILMHNLFVILSVLCLPKVEVPPSQSNSRSVCISSHFIWNWKSSDFAKINSTVGNKEFCTSLPYISSRCVCIRKEKWSRRLSEVVFAVSKSELLQLNRTQFPSLGIFVSKGSNKTHS